MVGGNIFLNHLPKNAIQVNSREYAIYFSKLTRLGAPFEKNMEDKTKWVESFLGYFLNNEIKIFKLMLKNFL